MGQHGLNGPAEGVGAQALREAIDRHQTADQRGTDRRPGALQHLKQGIGKRRSVGTLLHEPAHRHRGSRRKLTLLGLQPAWATEATTGEEAADPQTTRAVLQMELENREIGVAGTTEGVATTHRGHHRGGPTGNQGADAHQVGVIQVVAGVMGDQIPHQQQPEAGQLGGGPRTDAGHLGQGCAGQQRATGALSRTSGRGWSGVGTGGRQAGASSPLRWVLTGRALPWGAEQPQARRRHRQCWSTLDPDLVEPLAQLADQLLPAAQILQSVAAESRGQEREASHRVRGEIWGGNIKVAGHETGEGFVASHQIAEAALGLEPAGLLQGRKPGFQGLSGREGQFSFTGTGHNRRSRHCRRFPSQGFQQGCSGAGRIERMSCSHSASASCAWIRR